MNRILKCSRCGESFDLDPNKRGALCEVCRGDDAASLDAKLNLTKAQLVIAAWKTHWEREARIIGQTYIKTMDKNLRSNRDPHLHGECLDLLHKKVLEEQLLLFRALLAKELIETIENSDPYVELSIIRNIKSVKLEKEL